MTIAINHSLERMVRSAQGHHGQCTAEHQVGLDVNTYVTGNIAYRYQLGQNAHLTGIVNFVDRTFGIAFRLAQTTRLTRAVGIEIMGLQLTSVNCLCSGATHTPLRFFHITHTAGCPSGNRFHEAFGIGSRYDNNAILAASTAFVMRLASLSTGRFPMLREVETMNMDGQVVDTSFIYDFRTCERRF